MKVYKNLREAAEAAKDGAVWAVQAKAAMRARKVMPKSLGLLKDNGRGKKKHENWECAGGIQRYKWLWIHAHRDHGVKKLRFFRLPGNAIRVEADFEPWASRESIQFSLAKDRVEREDLDAAFA